MMRKVFAVALLTASFGVTSAQAGTTYDFVFRDTGTDSITVTPGETPIMDVLLVTSDALIAASVSIGFDNSGGLAVGNALEWSGLAIAFGTMMNEGVPTAFFSPIAPGVDIGPSSVSSFDGVTAPPNGPPSLAPGTYNIGTIVWDTSGGAGIASVFAFLIGGLDGTGAVLPPASNNIQGVTGTEVLGSGFINIVPEPATAGLLGLGLAGLVLAGRRRRA